MRQIKFHGKNKSSHVSCNPDNPFLKSFPELCMNVQAYGFTMISIYKIRIQFKNGSKEKERELKTEKTENASISTLDANDRKKCNIINPNGVTGCSA